MRSKSRKLPPLSEVHIDYWRIDITCAACRTDTGRSHRIGAVWRRPGIEATGTDMFVTPPLQIHQGSDGFKLRVLCSTCCLRKGALEPTWLDWSILVYRLKIMELQGIHMAEKAV